MMPFLSQNSLISFWKRLSGPALIERTCTYAIWPFVAFSTISRFFSTHSSYLMSPREATVRMRTSRVAFGSVAEATFTVTNSFSDSLSVFQMFSGGRTALPSRARTVSPTFRPSHSLSAGPSR